MRDLPFQLNRRPKTTNQIHKLYCWLLAHLRNQQLLKFEYGNTLCQLSTYTLSTMKRLSTLSFAMAVTIFSLAQQPLKVTTKRKSSE